MSRARLQSNPTILKIFYFVRTCSEKTLYPAGLAGINRQQHASAHLLELHLGPDIDDIVTRQHSN